jgi:molybdopterin converting factor small subunit
MTTITLNQNVSFLDKTFENVDELMQTLIDLKTSSLEEENFSERENIILNNRNNSIKNLEKEI